MAFNLLTKKQTARNWGLSSLGSDLPKMAEGYAPSTFWKPAQMEGKLKEIMSEPSNGYFGPKPSRDEALVTLAKYMRGKGIGPMVAGEADESGIGTEIGSLLLPANQQKALTNKIDDVRYDIRSAKGIIGAGMFALAGALAFLGVSSIYRTAKQGK